MLVAGHHLLRGARELGYGEVYVDVVDAATPPEEYLRHFAETVAECCGQDREFKAFPEARACI